MKSTIPTYKANNVTLYLIPPIRLHSKVPAVLRKPFKCATASATKGRTLLQTQWMDSQLQFLACDFVTAQRIHFANIKFEINGLNFGGGSTRKKGIRMDLNLTLDPLLNTMMDFPVFVIVKDK
ncbi:hypothetical protein CDAR_179091 [Caerostris darwini]|uniref:Uncharacterized protein n=1 Tax=Caerostris darwini TaxID=1538125 RepID=A0AAV4PB92_9ARAC|nr:hypothetical protein CDAR_179091 [Caerostris darwini]